MIQSKKASLSEQQARRVCLRGSDHAVTPDIQYKDLMVHGFLVVTAQINRAPET